MGENSQPQGLLKSIMDMAPLSGLGVTPQFSQRDIVVEMTTEQLRALLLEKADDRAKNSVTLELHEGKLVLRIRLW